MHDFDHHSEECLPLRHDARRIFRSTNPSIKKDSIVILDNQTFFLNRYATRLKHAGYTDVTTGTSFESILRSAFENTNLMIVDLSCATDFNQFFSFLELAKFRGYRGQLVVMSAVLTCDDLYRCAVLGISDFWIKGVHLQIEHEVADILTRKPKIKKEQLCPSKVANLGLFRTVGLSSKEIEFIKELADGFPRQREIAARLGKRSSYVHKTFSRIYEKLNVVLPVDNPPQLAHLITVCSMFK